MHKKKQISANEYLQLIESKKKGFNTLKRRRVCLIISNICYKIDYFPSIDGAPLIM